MCGESAAGRRSASLPEPTFCGALSAGRKGWTGAGQWVTRSSSTVMRTSAAILRSSVGEMSRPAWNGTAVTRPSGWRSCLCEPRLTILEQHLDHLAEVVLQLAIVRTLGVRAGPPRDMPNEQAGLRITLNDHWECSHSAHPLT